MVAEDRAVGIQSYLGLLSEIELLILNKGGIGKGFMCSLQEAVSLPASRQLMGSAAGPGAGNGVLWLVGLTDPCVLG